MDIETLTNHISKLGKAPLDIAAGLILKGVFNVHAINVDGTGDGGTDFSAFKPTGDRVPAAYQLTTQKKDISGKAYRDAKKAIDKLGITKYYFFSTADLSETAARKIEVEIEAELKITSYCFGARHIAGFLLDDQKLFWEFLDKANYPLPRGAAKHPDLREMALYGLTLTSDDSGAMRQGVYDDTILLMASEGRYNDVKLAEQVLEFLGLNSDRSVAIAKRIGALFAKQYLARGASGEVILSESAKIELDAREQVFAKERQDFASAQTDLMRTDFGSNWTTTDSEEASILIAHIYISSQLDILKETRPSFGLSPVFQIPERTVDDLKSFLVKRGVVPANLVEEATRKLLEISANHPLITKIARAAVYVALEGRNPITSSKALGAARWSDYSVLLEPSVAIPFICEELYNGARDRFFDSSVRAVKRAQQLGAATYITYYYINECAGHLLRARKYDGLELDPDEMRFSPNAFVANYYSLRSAGAKVPESFLEYLKTFSPAVATPRYDVKQWVRAIMTDLQSILTRASVEFAESPHYNHAECADIEKEYTFYLRESHRNKSLHLINHDVWALQMTNDRVTKNGEHWLVLTFDKAMIDVGATDKFKGWVTSPASFLDLTTIYRPLSEARYRNLVQKVATYSERTLAAGARILDRVIHYASSEMQNWEFRRELDTFRATAVMEANLEANDASQKIDHAVDEFLQSKGIAVGPAPEEDSADE